MLEHADGNEHFVTKRGAVQTFAEAQAQAGAEQMNQSLRAAAENNDPFCVSATTQTFGTYSFLLKAYPGEGAPVDVVRAVPRELSRTAILDQQRVRN